VVVDIDGVLSDAAGRQHHLRGPNPDWRAFFEAGADDPAIDELHALLELLAPGLVVCLVTARPARVQELTEVWLARHAVRWDLLVTRPRGSQGSSSDYKRATTHDLRAYGFDLKLAFEDDPRNVEMFRSEGVHCLYVHSGYYG
jgi:hypothetical protein